MTQNLQQQLGDIDIYLFDQILKGRFQPPMLFPLVQILDAGCGGGRNLIYFLRNGYSVCAVDQSAEAVAQVRQLAQKLAPQLPTNNFRVETVEQMSFPDKSFHAVISSAVLHFAFDETHWRAMTNEMWRVLKPGGIFFARLASTVGVENKLRHIEGRRFYLPDGNNLFLVDDEMLIDATKNLGGKLLEPIKTVIVERKRAMTTWCAVKD